MTFLAGTVLLILFISLGIPIGFALGLAGATSLAMIVPSPVILGLMTKLVHETAGSYIMVTVPMFILMAEFLSCGGVSQDLLVACNRLMRRVRGEAAQPLPPASHGPPIP